MKHALSRQADPRLSCFGQRALGSKPWEQMYESQPFLTWQVLQGARDPWVSPPASELPRLREIHSCHGSLGDLAGATNKLSQRSRSRSHHVQTGALEPKQPSYWKLRESLGQTLSESSEQAWPSIGSQTCPRASIGLSA